MDIKILGPGCRNCATLESRTREALEHLGADGTITKVTDLMEIAGYGVMKTPGLVVDEELVVSGRVPTTDAIERLLEERLGSPGVDGPAAARRTP